MEGYIIGLKEVSSYGARYGVDFPLKHKPSITLPPETQPAYITSEVDVSWLFQ